MGWDRVIVREGGKCSYILKRIGTHTHTHTHTALNLLIPVGELHHDVESGQEHHPMKERVAVCDPVLLIIHITGLLILVITVIISTETTTTMVR